jgi:uncharacterized protein (DUF4415 family)
MAMIYKTIDDLSQPLTPKQIKMLQEAAAMDIPEEFTDEELKEFERVSQGRRAARQKQNVTLRLSPRALAKARSLGKGYTSVLSRILEEGLDDPEVIKRNL